MKHLSVLILLVALSSLYTGCAVTTKSLELEDIQKRIAVDREAMYKGQESLKTPITLEEAMARAIKYNLDHRLKLMESALSLRQLNLMTYDMLPRLVTSAGYTARNSYNASSSMDVATGLQSLAPSTSQDKVHFDGDLALTWNILDFGVSYFQAKQQSDRAHIMKERRRKVIHSIMQQIRQQYWLALGAQQLDGRLGDLLKEVESALKDASNIEKEKLRPALETLTYRKALLEILKQLEVFRDEMAQAKPQLASLMNLPLGQPFALASTMQLKNLRGPDPLQYLEIRAMLQRPELIEADYNERISLDETRKAIVRMLPGIELSIGEHYDNNSFLLHKQWAEGGARLTWNLMNLISGHSQYQVAISQVEIAQVQRLALSVAILTQVHVSYQNFFSRKRQLELSEQLQNIDTRIFEQTMNQTKSGSENRLNEIRTATAALMSEYRTYQNYASLQGACGQIIASIGDDPLPATITSHEIKTLSEEIGARLYAPGAMCTPIETPPAAAVQVVSPASPPAPTLLLTVNPDIISRGQSAKLVWIAKNAVKCDIQPGIGVVKPLGERDVSPSGSTAYTALCDGDGGTASDTVHLTVAQPVSNCKQRSPMVLSVEFDTAKSDIKPEYYATLNKFADFLKDCPEISGEIVGHTDNVRFDNLKLSLQRANSVRAYLVQNFGIDPKRFTTKGYGDTRPVASNRSEEGRRKNRRIEAVFR